MSDMTFIADDIINTTKAIDENFIVAEELRTNNDHATFDVFRAKLDELHDHLSKLKMIMDNEEAFAMDELMDAMSKAYSGHRADYRKMPRVNG